MSSAFTEAFDGCYEARRAAALSGVPLSTVYYWARTEIVTPNVSQDRPKLWSYADLMALRIVSWLRHPKGDGDLPPSPMPEVRRALQRIADQGLDLWGSDSAGAVGSPLQVDRSGRIFIAIDDGVTDSAGHGVLKHDALDLLGVFEVDGVRGPDLRQPRPHLRIVPGKVAGEPHVAGTRITTSALAALHHRGFSRDLIAELYPEIDQEAIAEAVDLEGQLAGGLAPAA